jgi:uncharacterized MAPEG superfamily protein
VGRSNGNMGIAYLCVLIAAIMPMLFAGYAKFSAKGYNNSSPREFLDKLQGKGKRAHYAQLNSFEAFPAFAASIIIAHQAGVYSSFISTAAVVFIVFRILYGICYINDKASFRSLCWFGGFACVATLLIKSILISWGS